MSGTGESKRVNTIRTARGLYAAAMLALVALVLAACGDSRPPVCSGDECVDATADGVGDDARVDDAVSDASPEDGGDSDIALIDAEGDAGDGEDSDADAARLRDFGESCAADDECLSGFCIESDAGRICTRLCSGTCVEEGFTCRLLTNSGGDVVRLCVPGRRVECAPCTDDTECGGDGARCLALDNGDFCVRPCASGECNEGFECTGVFFPDPGGGEGEVVDVCEPVTRQCNPQRLEAVGTNATPDRLRSESFELTGRTWTFSHRSTSSSFTLVGGY